MASQPPVPEVPNQSPVDVPIPSPTDPIPPTPTDPVLDQGAGGQPIIEGP